MTRNRIAGSTKWDLARREVLKGLGLGAAFLPLLRAPRAHAHAPEKKLICVAAIQGYRQVRWRPALGPLRQPLPPSVAALEPHRDDLIFATDLSSQGAGTGNAGYSTMFYGLGSTVVTGAWREPTGATLDQVVATSSTPPPGAHASYAFGVQLDLPPRGATVPAGNRCFWRGPGQPVAPELDPQAAYLALFGDPAVVADLAKLRVQRKTVMDYVGGSLMRYSRRIGTEDQRFLEAHLAAIRQLERGLDRTSVATCTTRPAAIDLTDPMQYPKVLDAHTELMVAAMACGVLRVGTLQLADAYGYNVNFAFVPGIPDRGTGFKSPFRNWSDLAHNPILGGNDHKALVDKWWMDRLSALIARLKSTPDPGGGTLFDHTVVVWANPVDDGSARNSQKMPWIVAARPGGVLKTGQHVAGGASTGVMAAICRHLGVNHPFGSPNPALVA